MKAFNYLIITLFSQQLNGQNPITINKNEPPSDLIKLNISFGSEREYVLIHGKKPIVIRDLKAQLTKSFKIPPEHQNIVFKGYNLHDFMDEAPLSAFGLENNSQVSVWPKSFNSHPDLRLPKAPDQPATQMGDIYNTPRINMAPVIQPRWYLRTNLNSS